MDLASHFLHDALAFPLEKGIRDGVSFISPAHGFHRFGSAGCDGVLKGPADSKAILSGNSRQSQKSVSLRQPQPKIPVLQEVDLLVKHADMLEAFRGVQDGQNGYAVFQEECVAIKFKGSEGHSTDDDVAILADMAESPVGICVQCVRLAMIACGPGKKFEVCRIEDVVIVQVADP